MCDVSSAFNSLLFVLNVTPCEQSRYFIKYVSTTECHVTAVTGRALYLLQKDAKETLIQAASGESLSSLCVFRANYNLYFVVCCSRVTKVQ